MSTNQGPEYFAAEKHYLDAKTIEEKIMWLEEMIRNFKKHKGSENMLAELKKRLNRFLEKKEKSKKVGKSSKKGIKKEGFQVVLVGPTNSGKSFLLAKLTNAKPKVSSNQFTTTEPELGTLYHNGMKAQVVDLPSIGSEYFDLGVIHTADCLLIVIIRLEDLDKVAPYINRATGKKIIVINKTDLLDEEQLRKLEATLRSRKINGLAISTLTNYNIDSLKDKIMQSTDKIRVYTKEPGKPKSENPIMLPKNATVKDVAESILKGFSQKVRETRITGPSSKFPNQTVGLNHELKDQDIVEFHTK